MTNEPNSETEYVAPRHAAAILGLGDDRVRMLVRDGVLPAERLPDGRILIRRADVEALAEVRRKTHAERVVADV